MQSFSDKAKGPASQSAPRIIPPSVTKIAGRAVTSPPQDQDAWGDDDDLDF